MIINLQTFKTEVCWQLSFIAGHAKGAGGFGIWEKNPAVEVEVGRAFSLSCFATDWKPVQSSTGGAKKNRRIAGFGGESVIIQIAAEGRSVPSLCRHICQGVWTYLFLQPLCQFISGYIEVIVHLQAKPELRRHIKIPSQS